MNSNIESNKDKVETNAEKYLKRYAGKDLLKRHTLDEQGVWKVLGEDPNPDMGGPPYNPILGHFTGSLRDAIAWGVMQPKFWSWGGGGYFIKIAEEEAKENRVIEVEYYTASWNCPNCSEYTQDHDEGVDDQGDSFEVVCSNCKHTYTVKDRK